FTVMYINKAYEVFTGLSKEEFEGKSLVSFIEGFAALKEQLLSSLQHVCEQNTPYRQNNISFELSRPGTGENHIYHLDITSTPVQDDNNNVKYIIRTINDVTAL